MTPIAVSVIVTDIEGTTGSIAFVKDRLFPYAEARLADYIAEHPVETATILADVRALEGAPTLSSAAVAERLLTWSRADRKIAPLKSLQGMIWAEGYRTGELEGHIYPDAERALRRWRDAGIRLFVYSSGSVEAQKLLFGHTAFGDLTALFDGFFDTRTGGKLEAASYCKIAGVIRAKSDRILFLSDHPGEIAAALEAGWRVQLVDRDGRSPGAVSSFDAIAVERAP